ncbi:MAG: T9SS type A sorting domain-containing protein [Crocinitomicaceae bacterium]
MKNLYLFLCFVFCSVASLQAQNIAKTYTFTKLNQPSLPREKAPLKSEHYGTKMALWSEDFAGIGTSPTSTAGPTFTTANGIWSTGGSDGNLWKHSFFTSSGDFSAGLAPFASTTPENGFMLIDLDSLNSPAPPTLLNATAELISPIIDLTGVTTAKLSLKQNFRWCCNAEHIITISISSDNGVTWGTPFSVIPSIVASDDVFQTTTGSYDFSKNITAEAAGNNVMLKFTWDGIGADNASYFWNIDDIEISELPDDDIVMTSAFFRGVNNGGVQYGTTPETQLDASYLVGANLYNGGANTALNSTLTADFGSFSATSTLDTLLSDSAAIVQTIEAPPLVFGDYSGSYTIISDGDSTGTQSYNNSLIQNIKVEHMYDYFWDAYSMYAVDGIGVYQNPKYSSLGTDSFEGVEDGIVMATMYHFHNGGETSGFRITLAEGTQPGAEIYGSIIDSVTFWNNSMTAIFHTNAGTISSSDILAGYIDLYFPSNIFLSSGVYYAAVELYSHAGAAHVRILDDKTIEQPWYASAIYIPGDSVYTNGNAFAISIKHPQYGHLNENSLAGVSIFPNPTEGFINITNDNKSSNNIIVYNTLGEVVLTKSTNNSTSINLSTEGTGIYLIKVTNENGSFVERVVVK